MKTAVRGAVMMAMAVVAVMVIGVVSAFGAADQACVKVFKWGGCGEGDGFIGGNPDYQIKVCVRGGCWESSAVSTGNSSCNGDCEWNNGGQLPRLQCADLSSRTQVNSAVCIGMWDDDGADADDASGEKNWAELPDGTGYVCDNWDPGEPGTCDTSGWGASCPICGNDDCEGSSSANARYLSSYVDKGTDNPTMTSYPTGWTADDTPSFTWSGAADRSGIPQYNLKIDDNSDCSSPVQDYYQAGTSKTSDALADGTYYWCLRQKDGCNHWSGYTTTPGGSELKIDDTPPTAGTVTPMNNDTGTYVDSPFDLQTGFSDSGVGMASASCQYCKSTDGTCDTEWAAANWSGGTCSVTGLACSDGQSLTLNMRAYDDLNNLRTATAVSRTCDTTAPTTSDDWTDNWTTSGSVDVTLSVVENGGGVQGTWYCIDTTNGCTPTTSYTAPINFSCSSGNTCVRYIRYYSKDNLGQSESIKSERVRQDLENPVTTDNWGGNCSGDPSPQSPLPVQLLPDDNDGSGFTGGSSFTKYCIDATNTCTPDTSGTMASVWCEYGNTCQQYVRYYSQDYLGHTEATVKSVCVKQEIGQPTWLDQWDSGDDTGAGATTLVPSENTVKSHGPHSINKYSVNADSYDWFKVSMTGGRRYCFNSIGGVGDVYADLCSDSSCGTIVASNDNSGGDEQFSLCYTAAATQWYYLRLRGNPATNEIWYGDIHYYYTLVNSAPSPGTNNSDIARVQINDVDSVTCGCDGWPSGDTDFQMRVWVNGDQNGTCSTSRQNDTCGTNPSVSLNCYDYVSRTADPSVRVWITDEDGGLCEGWSCEDTLTNHTYDTLSSIGSAGWKTLDQHNAPCDTCYDAVSVYFNGVGIEDRGVDAPGSPTASPTTDTGTNGTMDFSWNQVTDRSGIDYYWFQLDDNSDFSSPIISKSTGSSTEITVGFGVFNPSTTYYWRVAAVSTCNNTAYTCSATTHVNYTSTQSFSLTDDDTSQPNMGTLEYSANIFDSNTNFTVSVLGNSSSDTGDDQSAVFSCVNTGLKYCAINFDREPVGSGSNSYTWDSGFRNAISSSVPSVEIDTKTTTRTGSQIGWHFEDYSFVGEGDNITDGQGEWQAVTMPEFTASTVDRTGKESFFDVDRLVIKLKLQSYMDEWCSVMWPFSCNPDESQPTIQVQTNRYNGSTWEGWVNRGSAISPEHGWTDREYTIVDTTNSATIASWNTGANQLKVRVLLGGAVGADVFETEYEEFYIRYPRFTADWYWHINSHSGVQFVPLTQELGVPVEFTCMYEDDDDDRGQNTDCSPSASLDVNYDCVNGAGQGKSGSCSSLTYTVTDDDTTAPDVTFDVTDYISPELVASVNLDAGASDPREGDEYGVSQVVFDYTGYSGGCGSSWTSIGTDTDPPDNDPSFRAVWSSFPVDGRYCVRATATDKDDDRVGDSLDGSATDNNVIIDRLPPINPSLTGVVDDEDDDSTCDGTTALADDTWQEISSDGCFKWNAASDDTSSTSDVSGVADYWVYYGEKCDSVTDGDGGYIGDVTHWANETDQGEGTFCFWIKVKDNAGNESTAVKLWTVKYDATPPTYGVVTPSNTDYNAQYVDSPYDLDTTFSDDGSGVASCEYTTDGSSWNPGSWTGTACDVNNIICTDGDTLTLNMKATDHAGNTGTAVSVNRTCDDLPPTVTEILPTSDDIEDTSITSGDLTCNDTASGLPSAAYDVQWCNDGTAKGGCDAGGTWNDTSPVGYSSTNNETITGTPGNYYRFRGRCVDNVGNESGWTYSTGYIFVDDQAPDNPSVSGYDSSGKNVSLTSGQTYSYDETTPGPYFEWSTPDDNPAGDNAGVKGYYLYFGTNSSADPSAYQADAGTNSYTNSSSLTAGNIYYLRVKTEDNAGNISGAATVFTYRYSGGAYLHVTEIDDDETSYGGDLGKSDGAMNDESVEKLDGVLAPNGTDFEIVVISLYDEWDSLATGGSLGSREVTVSLGNTGSTGAYISGTNLSGATPGGTSVTGNLSGGKGWVKVKATSAQNSAIYVEATASGLSGSGGHNQRAYILIRNETGASFGVGDVDKDVFSPVSGGTVMHPVWSQAGNAVVVAARSFFYPNWNLYKIPWNAGSWGSSVRLTNDNMCVQPFSKYTFSGNDAYVIFSSRGPDCTRSSEVEMYAVASDGTDKGASLAELTTAQQKISDGTGYYWYDAAWSRPGCASNGDRLLLSMMDMQHYGDMELFMLYGSKNASGLYTETTSSTPEQVTDLGGNDVLTMQGSWSYDCSKIVFTVWGDPGTPPTTGIYIIDLSQASLPITSLTDTGVTKVQECTSSSCTNGAALYPSFTRDGTMVSYMTEPNRAFAMKNLIWYGSTPAGNLASSFFSGVNFDNYLEYILDQPTFSPQLIGESANNEFGLVQCFGASCPDSANGNMFTYITQKTGSRDGKLSFLELSTVSNISSNGGLLFYQGAVTAVIPPGAIDSDTRLTVESSAPSGAPDSTDDVLVSVGEAREFYPDGVKFTKDIRLIFQYCDSDNDGFLDNNQDASCTGGGNSTIDEDNLYVYYWCGGGTSLGCTADTWEKLNGAVDRDNNTITVAINHFSKYDMVALSRGRFAPQNYVPLRLNGLHTFPNPWRTGEGDVTFFADDTSTYNTGGTIHVNVEIYDIRGKIVKMLTSIHSGIIPQSIENGAAGGLEIARWNVRNNSGSPLASGVYLYVLKINDGVFSKTYTGKLAVVR